MKWWKKEAVYQIYPKSFMDSNGDGIGDIEGIIGKLDYLKELGVGAIWLSPIFDSPQVDGGYDISDYYSIYKPYGSVEDVSRLIDCAHSLGIRVIMDLVVNHTSDKHRWFIESRKKDSPYHDYYYRKAAEKGDPPSNWAATFTKSAWTYDDESGEYYFNNFSSAQPDLNWNNPAVVNEVCKIMRFWQDKGVDGWRIDAIPYIDKNPDFPDYDPADFPDGCDRFMGKYHYKNGHLADFIRRLNRNVWQDYPDTVTVAELGEQFTVDEILKLTNPNDTFSMAFTFDHLFHDVDWSLGRDKWSVKDFDLVGFKRAIEKGQQLNAKGGNYAIYLNNHDQPRSVSLYAEYGEHRVEYAKALAIMLHMLGGTPFIYQGEELGMTNCPFEFDEYRDIDFFGCYKTFVEGGVMSREEFMKAAAVRCRDNSRTPMQWSRAKNGGFSCCTPWIKVNPNYREINAESQINDPHSVFSCYKRLLELRKELDVIAQGDFTLIDPDDSECFIYRREDESTRLSVVMNFTCKELKRKIDIPDGRVIISSYDDFRLPERVCRLRPFEAFAVLSD